MHTEGTLHSLKRRQTVEEMFNYALNHVKTTALALALEGGEGKKSLQECGAYEICREWARKHAENAGLILHRWGQTEQLL